MKKVLFYFGLFAVFTLFFASCGETTFDESLLIGKWKNDTRNEFYRYRANHTGGFWNEDEDVTEDEMRRMTWSLNGSQLEHIYLPSDVMPGDVSVTRDFTITVLNSTTLRYRDNFDGRTHSFTRVRE